MKFQNLIPIITLTFCLLMSACSGDLSGSVPGITPTLMDNPSIHDIQGAGHLSPYDGQEVTSVEGVVTWQTVDGFYLQAPTPDELDSTSEGIFIFTDTKPSINPGDLVSINGIVHEYFPGGENGGGLSITHIEKPQVTLLETNQPLPEPIFIGTNGRRPPAEISEDDQFMRFDPEQDGIDFYESLEGMLVSVEGPVAVAPTNQYGEIAILPDAARMGGIRSATGGLILQPDDVNPENLLLDDAFRPSPYIKIGTTFGLITGIIDYSYGNYKFEPIAKYSYEASKVQPGKAANPVPGELRVASYNVDNLDAQDPIQRFEILANDIVNRLHSPDIIGLQEIQDNTGPYEDRIVDSSETWGKIIAAIKTAGGPVYDYREIAPEANADGGEEGGNIRAGFLFRADTGIEFVDRGPVDASTRAELVQTQEGMQLRYNPARIEPQNSAFLSSRKPLIAEFRYAGEPLFIINLHLNSKGGDTPIMGSIQPPLVKSENQRVKQAKVVESFISQLLKMDPQARVIVLGDLNDYQWSTAVKTLAGDKLTDLVNGLPVEGQFTYIFEGNSQVLDHILVSNAVLDGTINYEIVHFNTILPYGDRLSDHDPQVMTIGFGN